MNCPCCSGISYAKCCQPFHDGKLPETALELMRSRYSAYALKKIEYIIDTTHPNSPSFEKNRQEWEKSIRKFSNESTFLKLEILDYGHDWVHFQAHLGSTILDERSRFVQSAGKWFYLNGEFKILQSSANPES